MVNDTPATAEGDLGRTPFAHLLVYALDKRLTGAFFLSEPGQDSPHVIRFVRGAAVKARPADRYSLLGEMLVEAGVLPEKTLNDALATKGLLGDMLMLTGCVDRDVLESTCVRQFEKRMVRFFQLPAETTYRYCDGHEELAEYGGEPAAVDPLELLWKGLREHGGPPEAQERALARLGEAPLRLHAQATIDRLGLTGEAFEVVERLKKEPISLAALLALGVGPEDVVKRVCYALAITRQIETTAGLIPAGAEPVPPSTRDGTAPVGRVVLKATTYRLGAAAPDLPGTGERTADPTRTPSEQPRPKSNPTAQKSASTPAAAATMPVPAAAPAVTPAPAATPTAEATPAAAVTPTPAVTPAPAATPARAAPIPVPAAAGPKKDVETLRSMEPLRPHTPERQAELSVLSAPALYQLATTKLGERDFEGALDACATARLAAPGEPDYGALSVWIRLQMGGADLKSLSIEIDELLQAHEGHVQARYYRSILRRKLGDDASAVRDLRRVVELAPGHPEATRELEALAPPKPAARSGLLGWLFKR